MTHYFMQDTPLFHLERQMMTPPNFKPRGHGRYSPGFQYSNEDTECQYCMNFRRKQPCPLKLCICLDERIMSGALDLNEFVRDCFFPEADARLRARLEQNFNCSSISFFLNESHRERWQHWRERCFRMPNRNLAALFLLTAYHYEADMTAVGISSRWEPENSRNVTWIYLPASKGQIERAMQRSGIADPKDMRLFMADSSFPEEVDVALDFRCDNIYELNELALVADKLSCDDRKKLGAAVSMAKPECASQIRRLAENLDLFEFAPGTHTPEEYGKYMIQKSGHFEYDPNLDEFYDYERYGLQHMDYQSGVFTDRGYIAYVGTVSLEELMADAPAESYQREQDFHMGGMT